MKKISIISFFILAGNLAFPVVLTLLFLQSDRSFYRALFLLFMLIHAFERVWETFFTSKERHGYEIHGDWTLVVVTAAYLILCFSLSLEFFLSGITPKIEIVCIGLILYLGSFTLRWWGMRSLGKQWAIHAVGVQKIRKVRLLRIGAYKWIRHPIYLGVVLEVLSLPTIANTFFSLIFAVAVNIPLQYVRAVMEEKYSARRFGLQYEQYKSEVGMFLPFKYLLRRFNISKYVGC